MIVIMDYGVGNLFSLCSSLRFIGASAKVSNQADDIRAADKLILPGVGAFGDAMDKLRASGLLPCLLEEAAAGKEILGICLGMQLLFESSREFGEHPGLGLLPGRILPLQDYISPDLKVPHIGWNKLRIRRRHHLLRHLSGEPFVYFVHSYFAADCADSLLADTDYGIALPAVVAKDRIYGCQFHPEKSGEAGLQILRAFCEGEGAF